MKSLILACVFLVGCGAMRVQYGDYQFEAWSAGKVRAESCRPVRAPREPMCSETDPLIMACDRLDGSEVSNTFAGIMSTLGTVALGFATGGIRF